ncbi:pyridoxamine 5'-phosphate oxidase family protein [Saccharopolyspora shandongensis]|uniref:pyridoxamine 5'-phosphate oxidase family protein n=1 Tax=Saccharopolyspora shandongensis TaxID=418495 RepID=UPI0034173661
MQPAQEMQAVHDKLVEVLAASSSLYLATASDKSIWNSGAFYAELSPFTLTLVLESHGITLRNLMANSTSAIVIAPDGPFQPFLQGAAQAIVRDATGKEATTEALLRKEPQVEPLLKAGPVEAVELQVSRWRVTDISAGWLPGKELTPGAVSPPRE